MILHSRDLTNDIKRKLTFLPNIFFSSSFPGHQQNLTGHQKQQSLKDLYLRHVQCHQPRQRLTTRIGQWLYFVLSTPFLLPGSSAIFFNDHKRYKRSIFAFVFLILCHLGICKAPGKENRLWKSLCVPISSHLVERPQKLGRC